MTGVAGREDLDRSQHAYVVSLARIEALFRTESKRFELPAPFGWRIAEPLDTDAAGQTTFDRCLDQAGREEASEMAILTCLTLHFSRTQIPWTVVTRPETTSSSHWRPLAMALTRRARRSNCFGWTSLRDALWGSRIRRDRLDGGFCQGIVSD